MTGTPKFLEGAIENGLQAALVTKSDPVEEVRAHVRDYLAQHFMTAMLEYPELESPLMDLFRRVVGEEGRSAQILAINGRRPA